MRSVFSKHKGMFLALILAILLLKIGAILIAWIDVAWVSFATNTLQHSVVFIAIVSSIIIITRVILMKIWAYLWFVYPSRAIIHMKTILMETLLKFKSGMFEKPNSEIISTLTNDFFQIRHRIFRSTFVAIDGSFEFIVASIVLAVIDFRLFAASLFISILPVIIGGRLQRYSQKRQADIVKRNADLVEQTKEVHNGLQVIRSYSAQKKFFDSSLSRGQKLEEARYKANNTDAFVSEISSFFGQLLFFTVVLISSWLLSSGRIDIGVILLIFMFCIRIENSVARAVPSWVAFKSVKPVAQRILNLINDREAYNGSEIRSDIGSIIFKNVTVKYGDRVALDNFSYDFEAGKKYLITGSSGCGKTTLLHVLAKRIENYEGEVSIKSNEGNSSDGSSQGLTRNQHLCEINYIEWNKKISYTTQNVFMLNASVRENIEFGDGFTQKEIDAAIRQANLSHDMLDRDTDQTSGGERQRVALARALLRQREILLLDEVNAELDNVASKEILQTILNLPATVICVLHRFDNEIAGMFDEVIQMQNGESNRDVA